jgi:hypothetical protein
MIKIFLISFFTILVVLLFSCTENASKNTLTFNKDIAVIIHKNCSPCHRKGEAGPFELITYKDVKRKSKTIAKVVAAGIMPPWPADPEYRHYAGEKILTAAEKNSILDWIRNDAPEGDPSHPPTLPVFNDQSQFGKPDMVISMEHPYIIKGDNTDRFMVMKIPFELEQDTFLRMVEYIPGNRKLAHHVNGHIIQYDEKSKKNIYEGPRYVNREQAGTLDSCYKYLKLLNDDGSYPLLTPSVFNYLPGVIPQQYPAGIGGYRIKKKGAVLMRDIHYGPTPVEQQDLSRINLFFAAAAPERPFMETQLGTLGISEIVPPLLIPADTVMKFITRAVIRNDISLVTINPHMHLLGKSFLSYAVLPSGDTIPLVRIKNWDFRWQYFYTFKKIIAIPAGSIIIAEGVFDNTSKNPNNPFSPPREITGIGGSMKTTDEMFQLILTFLPYRTGDENISLENLPPSPQGLP